MTYEELKISIDLNGYENVMSNIGMKRFDGKHWFIVCDDGDYHLFDRYGNEDDISKIKEINEDMIPKDIKKIIIPDNVMSIGYWTFFNCYELANVTIGNGVKNIEWSAFRGCSNLKSLIFKNKTLNQVKSMENYPFGIKDELIIKCI